MGSVRRHVLISPDRFQLKFQQIVQDEQGSNFISRLHGGKLAIVAWPVIGSEGFYTSFNQLKKRLDKQEISHPRAGIFLQTMKTLMAKLKVLAYSFGTALHSLLFGRIERQTTGGPCRVSISSVRIQFSNISLAENMASHRAQLLSSLLPTALCLGLTELSPVPEPLKVCTSIPATSNDLMFRRISTQVWYSKHRTPMHNFSCRELMQSTSLVI